MRVCFSKIFHGIGEIAINGCFPVFELLLSGFGAKRSFAFVLFGSFSFKKRNKSSFWFFFFQEKELRYFGICIVSVISFSVSSRPHCALTPADFITASPRFTVLRNSRTSRILYTGVAFLAGARSPHSRSM